MVICLGPLSSYFRASLITIPSRVCLNLRPPFPSFFLLSHVPLSPRLSLTVSFSKQFYFANRCVLRDCVGIGVMRYFSTWQRLCVLRPPVSKCHPAQSSIFISRLAAQPTFNSTHSTQVLTGPHPPPSGGGAKHPPGRRRCQTHPARRRCQDV